MEVMERLHSHLREVSQEFSGSRVLGIFCIGSQNYGLSTEKSDLDSRLIILPDIKDIIFGKRISCVRKLQNGDTIDVKDVRLALPNLKKQNINSLEILFTNYAIVNPLYAHEWNKLLEAREAITRYDENAAMHSIWGQYWENKQVYIELQSELGYNSKKLCNMIKNKWFMSAYASNLPFIELLKVPHTQYLKDLKEGKIKLSKEETRDIENRAENLMQTLLRDFKPKPIDEEIGKLLDSVLFDIMKKGLKEEARV